MATKCCCDKKDEVACASCQLDEIFSYWCDSCKRPVSEKRCPLCGLKTKKKRETPV